ncbi:putative arrestin-related trafficking adapter C2D10.04 [Hirsutella rhossiliensis]|uniref:Arrestin-related trafficking adapter C2D10.04 n=1 Tax=Hirsutella rhossiliensis TaxID=111463 RepID=A0A9P8SHU9_9HYPO|nr:putative arrestin-related trafficking adapter C2D10.04 [Hirsutella rhossiliensis]KAH0961386.1 putative arrestin-related trafficking adapter C2D10.04 [Hirsutella rhossiliensis]
MPAPARQNRSRNGNWIISNGGNVFYRADSLTREGSAAQQSSPTLPAPLIGPRRTRPHAIHIVTYPPGYVPRELRPKPASKSKKAADSLRSRSKKAAKPGSSDAQNSADAGGNVGSSSSSRRRTPARPHPCHRIQIPIQPSTSLNTHLRQQSSLRIEAHSQLRPRPLRQHQQNRYSLPLPQALTALSALRFSDDLDASLVRPTSASSRSITADHLASVSSPPYSAIANAHAMAAMIPPAAYHLGGAGGNSNRNSLMSVRSAKSAVSSLVAEVPKPVASGSGVTCSILMAEPNVFLSGFDHDHDTQRESSSGGTALLRGKLHLSVSKNVKIKAVQLKLIGRARTEWPEGIPPLKQDVVEEESLRTQVLTFFNAMNDGWETEYGNQCTYQLRASSATSSSTNLGTMPRVHSLKPISTPNRGGLTAKELKRLSLQSVQSRSFGKGDSGVAVSTQAKGFKIFYPGTYDYSFELPIDHHQLETTKLQYGSVRWELHATVDRAGAFKPNLHGMKEVSIVRLPDQMSLETTEPISISRQWEDQLHYDIVISGKSFPIGSKIPIAFKLTPLAKVQIHKLKVYVTETIEYWTNDKRVTRKDPGRKILLLEKSAGKPLDSTWASSDMRTVRGGEPSAEERRDAREVAQLRRVLEASRTRSSPEPLPEPSANLLGDLELGLESMWGSTEIEANVQIPTCEMMAKNKDLKLHPDCSWKNVNVFHWIKIVMRISRVDPEDPTGTKRRHFEISIDSPFTVLNCRATQANTNLPAYSGPVSQPSPFQAACGCPDAASVATGISPSSSTGTLLGGEPMTDVLPLPPQAAHLPSPTAASFATDLQSPNASAEGPGAYEDARPIHLMRAPSFDPPAFYADIAPPPAIVIENPDAVVTPAILTPPPQYDAVVGTPSVDGLADYFSRLARHGFPDEEDSNSESEELPTPGGRMPSRSMEIPRPSLTLDLDSLPDRSREPAIPGLAV